ncbi:hypothetical protein DND67_30480 [Pseudomonas syringae pv. pisi]|nr:hypothetical protein DND67_30480 [Pseudomonas syringae pv. pisi]
MVNFVELLTIYVVTFLNQNIKKSKLTEFDYFSIELLIVGSFNKISCFQFLSAFCYLLLSGFYN